MIFHGMNFLTILWLSGRSWKASELRLKSWDDLNKLWYVLLKEKNMLMTQRQMLHAQNLRFPNPERVPKVLVVVNFINASARIATKNIMMNRIDRSCGGPKFSSRSR